MKPKINLQLTGPAIATDGNAIQIDGKSGQVNLIFFQVAQQNGDEVFANSVSNIRLTVDMLRSLRDAINKVLDQPVESSKEADKK